MDVASQRRRPWVRRGLLFLAALLLVAAVITGGGWWYLNPTVQRTDGIVYGQRGSRDLTLDILRPAGPNGVGILLLVSGGWRSKPAGRFPLWTAGPLLRRGYTVFAVCHVSQPQSTIGEIATDMHRAVRFVRYHARGFGVDPQRLGVTGGSAGGHLALLLATRGGPGQVDAIDPVERESSAVQAAAVFFPVTDLLNLGASTENAGDGGPPRSFVAGFGSGARDPSTWTALGRELSPIYHLRAGLPPVLIHHGDADTLTPLDQSLRFRDAARRIGVDVELVVKPGGGHAWLTMPWDIRAFGLWFDQRLKPGARNRRQSSRVSRRLSRQPCTDGWIRRTALL